jgi:hypothetical protein
MGPGFATRGDAAEIKTVAERNAQADANPELRFPKLPVPTKTDRGVLAKVSIIDGEADANGADVEALVDGLLPARDDEPSRAFFFDAGTRGGRILFDLGDSVEIRSIESYSWHPGTRGPQVYELYAADGAAPGFVKEPKRGTDPAGAGWTKLSSIDTRSASERPGGQYAASTREASGAAMGRYRYLLFDVSPTETDDRFGNTFFGEIDIRDGKEYTAPTRALGAGDYDIRIRTTEAPELADWAETKLRPVLEKWYPIIVDALPSEGYEAPKRFTVTFRKDMSGVAATSGTRVDCAVRWFRQNLEGEAIGAVVHELVHVAQQYRGRGQPGWLVEGIADYLRWFRYEPERLRPRPNPDRAKYTDSYRTTAAFLNYLMETRDKDLVRKFNVILRAGKYTPGAWTDLTGKSVDELWTEYTDSLRKPREKASGGEEKRVERPAGEAAEKPAEKLLEKPAEGSGPTVEKRF